MFLSGWALAIAILVCGCWRAYQRLWKNPLSAAKNVHWSAPYTGFWIWWQHFNDRSAEAVHQAHVRHGPVVRLAPAELSVCEIKGGLDVIYSFKDALPKSDWYEVANSYGEEPMVAIRDETPHRLRKKLLAHPYSKTTLRRNQRWVAAQKYLARSFVSTLEGISSAESGPDIYDLAFAWSVDAISEYIYGPGTTLNLLADVPKARRVREEYEAQRAYQFLPLPTLVLRQLGYRPEINWIHTMQENAAARPDTGYGHMRKGMEEGRKNEVNADTLPPRNEEAIISSEMQDHMIAGIDTSAAVLTTCAWLLSLPTNRTWQSRLREELNSVEFPPTAADLEMLPLLDAIVKETLRLHSPVSGSQPRKTNKTVMLGPPGQRIIVPAGITVHAQAHTLHRSDAFEHPDEFDPGRWLHSSPEHLLEMERWYWPFGSGSRACIGMQLGLDNLKIALASLFASFHTETIEGTTYRLSKGVIAMPVSQDGYHLRLKIDRVAK